WWVGRRDFTSGLSQNGAGASRLTPLPSSEPANRPLPPMHEQIGMPFRDAFEEEARPYLVAFQPFVLPHRPSDQRSVEVLEDRKPPIIRHPATQDRIV